jgi:hypothetical protein
VVFKKRGDKDLDDEVNIENRVLRVLKKNILDANVSPCIVELEDCAVINELGQKLDKVDCKRQEKMSRAVQEPPVQLLAHLCELNWERERSGRFYDHLHLQALERLDYTIERFLRSYMDTPTDFLVLKSVLFMIVYTLYRITKRYPGFRHYDLHVGNIMIKRDDDFVFDVLKPKFLVFHDDDTKFVVPYFGLIPKIIDFGFATIPEENIASPVLTDVYYSQPRPESDIIFFLWWVWERVSQFSSPRLFSLFHAIDPDNTFLEGFHTMTENKSVDYRKIVYSKGWREYINTEVDPKQIYMAYTG